MLCLVKNFIKFVFIKVVLLLSFEMGNIWMCHLVGSNLQKASKRQHDGVLALFQPNDMVYVSFRFCEFHFFSTVIVGYE